MNNLALLKVNNSAFTKRNTLFSDWIDENQAESTKQGPLAERDNSMQASV